MTNEKETEERCRIIINYFIHCVQSVAINAYENINLFGANVTLLFPLNDAMRIADDIPRCVCIGAP